jgi:hypothetical protein
MGVTAMTSASWTRKELALIVAIVALACAVAFLSVKLTRPKPSPSASLGIEWQSITMAGNPGDLHQVSSRIRIE